MRRGRPSPDVTSAACGRKIQAQIAYKGARKEVFFLPYSAIQGWNLKTTARVGTELTPMGAKQWVMPCLKTTRAYCMGMVIGIIWSFISQLTSPKGLFIGFENLRYQKGQAFLLPLVLRPPLREALLAPYKSRRNGVPSERQCGDGERREPDR